MGFKKRILFLTLLLLLITNLTLFHCATFFGKKQGYFLEFLFYRIV